MLRPAFRLRNRTCDSLISFSGLAFAPHIRTAMSLNGSINGAQLSQGKLADNVKLDVFSVTQQHDNAAKRKEIARTFTSDTITVPTPEMYEYALAASLGDDVYAVDTCTIALENHLAKITGKEAGLFMPSGTMSNQVALRTHLKQPPYSVIGDTRSHILQYEAGGLAANSGAQGIPVIPRNDEYLTLQDIEENVILSDDVHFAPTKIIALENTLRGTVIPQDEVVAISEFARKNDVLMHLDGARIWHVAVKSGLSVEELCRPFDSVSVCFSKGLGAPIGSCLVGSKDYIKKARHFRKMFGGGLRQIGFNSACAAYALTHNFPFLERTHALAQKLADGLTKSGLYVWPVSTNMVFFDPQPAGLDYNSIISHLAQLPDPVYLGGSRVVLHFQTSEAAVDDFIVAVSDLVEEKKRSGFKSDSSYKPRSVTQAYVRAGKK